MLPAASNGDPFLSMSFHGRVSVRPSEVIGLFATAVATCSPLTYFAKLAFTAVLPSPKRSYATPIRGEMSFQFCTWPTHWFFVLFMPSAHLSKCTAELNRPARRS